MADPDPLRTSIAAELGSMADLARAVASPDPVTLPPGVVVGDHFVVEGVLGRGGMGVVYRARDRRLERWVALKLDLRGADLARVQREASALARLAHPNVVTIYEIGEHDGAGFVAMELCTGGSVRTWLAAGVRPWRAILAVFVAAGRGLAAAHAAGLVHRDIKPDNLLLGEDGRPRVADFGLARDAAGLTSVGGSATATGSEVETVAGGGPDPAHAVTMPSPAPRSGSDRLTETGAIVGTPRYMAPEQFAGGVLGAAVDQFAFAVALYEAMAGVDPFPAALDRRLAAITAGRIAPPRRPVPRRVLAPLTRAMAATAAARWPSLDALLAALTAAARPRWPWLIAIAGAGAAIATTVIVTQATAHRRPAAAAVTVAAPAPCDGLAVDVSDRWGAGPRAAFVAGNPAAGPAATFVADHLDVQARNWRAARHRLCVELPGQPVWSAQLESAGRRCLENRRIELERAAALRGKTAGALTALVLVGAPPSSCAQPSELGVLELEPGQAEAEAAFHQVELAIESGRFRDALERARQAVAALAADAGPMTRGLSEYAFGRAAIASADLAGAEPHLRAAFLALRSANSSLAFAVATKMTEALCESTKVALAREWLGYAHAEASRLELATSNRALLELLASRVAEIEGDVAGALTATERGLAIADACAEPACRLAGLELRSAQAIYLASAGKTAASLTVARQVVAERGRLYGEGAGELITDLFNVGLAELDLGQLDAGLASLARARTIAEAHLAPETPLYAIAVWNHALAIGRRDPRAARPVFDQALAIIEKLEGPDSADARELRADRARWSRVR